MTEEQIEKCAYLHKRKEGYEKALNMLLDNADAEILIAHWVGDLYKYIYIPACGTENDIKELNIIVENFIKDKIQKINEELKSL